MCVLEIAAWQPSADQIRAAGLRARRRVIGGCAVISAIKGTGLGRGWERYLGRDIVQAYGERGEGGLKANILVSDLTTLGHQNRGSRVVSVLSWVPTRRQEGGRAVTPGYGHAKPWAQLRFLISLVLPSGPTSAILVP